MSTASRAEINLANSQHSTGPKSAEGKQRSSQNALRHGLTSQSAVMPADDPDAYQLHLKSYIGEYNPKGATESDLVQSLADISWRLNRVTAIETKLLDQAASSSPESLAKTLASMSMHSHRLSRQFKDTRAELRELQATRREKEQAELDALLDILEMHDYAGKSMEPFDTSTCGFVFSDAEIKAGFQARNLYKLSVKAKNYRYASYL